MGMSGSGDHAMVFPQAYNVAPPFFAFANNDATGYAEYDSWLTIGITDGSGGGDLSLSSGFNLATWSVDQGIDCDNCAVFYMDPGIGPSGRDPIVMAQLTVANAIAATGSAQATLQGRSAGNAPDWSTDVEWTW